MSLSDSTCLAKSSTQPTAGFLSGFIIQALFASRFPIRWPAVEKMYVRFAGFLPGVDTFDASLFR